MLKYVTETCHWISTDSDLQKFSIIMINHFHDGHFEECTSKNALLLLSVDV